MAGLPFYVPDFEMNLKIGKIILLMNNLSFNRNKTPVLTIEKIAIFEFLTKHPILLNKILYLKDKERIVLTNSELYSIEALFPNRKKLYDLNEIKRLVKILMIYEFVEIELTKDGQVFYLINDKGKLYAENLNSIYFKRLNKILLKIKPIQSQTFTKINQHIEHYITYGIKN